MGRRFLRGWAGGVGDESSGWLGWEERSKMYMLHWLVLMVVGWMDVQND